MSVSSTQQSAVLRRAKVDETPEALEIRLASGLDVRRAVSVGLGASVVLGHVGVLLWFDRNASGPGWLDLALWALAAGAALVMILAFAAALTPGEEEVTITESELVVRRKTLGAWTTRREALPAGAAIGSGYGNYEWMLHFSRPERQLPMFPLLAGLSSDEAKEVLARIHERFPSLRPDPWIGKRLGI